MGKFGKLVWFTIQNVMVGAPVYISIQSGVWGTPEETTALASKVYDALPELKDLNAEYLAEYLPKKKDVNINFRHYWNSAILYTGDFLADSPAKVAYLRDYILDVTSSFISESSGEKKKQES